MRLLLFVRLLSDPIELRGHTRQSQLLTVLFDQRLFQLRFHCGHLSVHRITS